MHAQRRLRLMLVALTCASRYVESNAASRLRSVQKATRELTLLQRHMHVTLLRCLRTVTTPSFINRLRWTEGRLNFICRMLCLQYRSRAERGAMVNRRFVVSITVAVSEMRLTFCSKQK